MDIFKQIHEENAKHDPHGLKNQGENSAKHSLVNAPYEFQQFPQVVYKSSPDGTLTLTVSDSAELANALADGWSETVVAEPAEEAKTETETENIEAENQ